MATQAADAEGEDEWELVGFEEEDHCEHGEASLTFESDGEDDEEDDEGRRDEDDVAGFHDEHQTRGDESADGEDRLPNGISVTGVCGGEARDMDGVGDELGSYGHLRADIAD